MSDSGDNGDNGSSAQAESTAILTYIAFAISLVALLGTGAQVAQQYYASATGYAHCPESVMGAWHTTKRRIFRPTEVRFEVRFEAPVLFVCPPKNKKGPIKDAQINIVSGYPKSWAATRANLPAEEKKANRVHTADNERATWLTMLSELQQMEQDSREWQQKQYNKSEPHRDRQVDFEEHHTLAVAVQAKKRSWDTMPAGVKKPYATSAMCHVIEIAAMLGLYWQEFDRSKDRYRAEGNGYMLIGNTVPDLGLMFAFQVCGQNRFQENRVIPVQEVKELSFGFASTIFRKEKDPIDPLDEDRRKPTTVLQLGSPNELAETFVVIGCNTNTANFFRSETERHGHLFPVAFELLGMLGRNLHIHNSSFRMIPNPTPYHWDKKFFSLPKLLREYKKKIKDEDFVTPQTEIVRRLGQMAEDVQVQLRNSPSDYAIPLLNVLHGAVDECETFLRGDGVEHQLVTMVLREHFQEVLRMINADDSEESEAQPPPHASSTERRPRSRSSVRRDQHEQHTQQPQHPRKPRFDDLNAASPEEKQEQFMDIYFSVVLPRVRRQAVESFQRRKTTMYAASAQGLDDSGSATPSRSPSPRRNSSSHLTPSARPTSPGVVGLHANYIGVKDTEKEANGAVSEPSVPLPRFPDVTEDLDTQAGNIWCTLVFRMLCWLMLHDFHKMDVQISKSELLGSRLPVYIA